MTRYDNESRENGESVVVDVDDIGFDADGFVVVIDSRIH